MRMSFSIPDAVAHRFQAAIPARQRSSLVTRLLENELSKHDDGLAAACRTASSDKALNEEIKEWQFFGDTLEK